MNINMFLFTCLFIFLSILFLIYRLLFYSNNSPIPGEECYFIYFICFFVFFYLFVYLVYFSLINQENKSIPSLALSLLLSYTSLSNTHTHTCGSNVEEMEGGQDQEPLANVFHSHDTQMWKLLRSSFI